MSTNTFDRELILSEEDYARLLKILERPRNRYGISIITKGMNITKLSITAAKTVRVCSDLAFVANEDNDDTLAIIISGKSSYEEEMKQYVERIERLWKRYFYDVNTNIDNIELICDRFMKEFFIIAENCEFIATIEIEFWR